MKKSISLGILTLLALLIGMPFATAFETPLPPTPPEEISGVSLMGMVETYNGEPAYGWLTVHAKIGDWAKVFGIVVPGETSMSINETWHHEWENFTYSFIFIELNNASIVELNYTGYDLYIGGLWSVYNVTISYKVCEGLNVTLNPILEEAEGQLAVFNGWSMFSLNIANEVIVDGAVFHCVFHTVKILCHDFTADQQVDIFDLMMAAKVYGKVFGMFGYNIEYDIQCDFQIDIYDLLEICSEFE